MKRTVWSISRHHNYRRAAKKISKKNVLIKQSFWFKLLNFQSFGVFFLEFYFLASQSYNIVPEQANIKSLSVKQKQGLLNMPRSVLFQATSEKQTGSSDHDFQDALVSIYKNSESPPTNLLHSIDIFSKTHFWKWNIFIKNKDFLISIFLNF